MGQAQWLAVEKLVGGFTGESSVKDAVVEVDGMMDHFCLEDPRQLGI